LSFPVADGGLVEAASRPRWGFPFAEALSTPLQPSP
jgi:hypothetical protein